jgi:hypothetical protein
VPAHQDGDIGTRVSLVWRDIPNRLVTMLGVVPRDKASDPLTCNVAGCEGQTRIGWRVLQGSKQLMSRERAAQLVLTLVPRLADDGWYLASESTMYRSGDTIVRTSPGYNATAVMAQGPLAAL